MEQPTVPGAAHDPSGGKFTIVGVSNMPTDWAQIFRAVANGDLNIEMLAQGGTTPGAPPQTPHPAHGGAFDGSSGPAKISAQRPVSMTPPSVLNLNAYLMYATGKAARRRLTERLAAHGRNHGLAITRIRTEDGEEMPAADYFRSTGGYVTTHN